MISCDMASELLTGYMGKALSPAETVTLMAHLTKCPSCCRELVQWTALKKCLTAELEESSPVLPPTLVDTAFAQLPDREDDSEVSVMTAGDALHKAFEALRFTRKTINFAFQLI